MKIKHLLSAFAGCAMIAFASLTAAAQTGRLEGDVVKADTKEPIVGAEVQIERTDIKGSYPVKTDKKGHFLHAGVPYVGTYTVMVSAPGCMPDYVQNVKGSQTDPLKFELHSGDGKKLTVAEVKGMQASAPKGGQQMSAADQKKAMEEYEKKRAEVEAKNSKMKEEYESMKKRFEAGQQLMAAKDWNGAANEFGEAAKIDAEQQAVWQGLSLALYNRGVTSFNEFTKDPTNTAKKDAAKQDFNDSINAIGKAMALAEPLLNDPQKGAQAKKSKAAYLKSKADAEGLLAKKLLVAEMIEPAVKDYREVAESAETPADKVKYQLSAAEVYFDAGKAEEAVTAYTAIIEANPDNLDAIYKLGLAYASVAKFQESANTFQKFLDKAPENDARVPEVKAVLKDLVVGNNLQPPKSEPSRGKAAAKKKP
ncbi:MAG TPA: carboxypeptidase regulatory-like domain-containing protein [Blastocatellia bacterium]|jgi:tetratricopeptide (TPR) repeat protein|nr:carboxypeptidase regulatory-like domain-containing protein [Blastocatellia bacterium]